MLFSATSSIDISGIVKDYFLTVP